MPAMRQDSHSILDLKYCLTDIEKLEICDRSATEAKEPGIIRVKGSVTTTKCLYEVIFPPQFRGQTRYLEGPRLLGPLAFPNLLVKIQYRKNCSELVHSDCTCRPLFWAAKRVDKGPDQDSIALGNTYKVKQENPLEIFCKDFLTEMFHNYVDFWGSRIYIFEEVLRHVNAPTCTRRTYGLPNGLPILDLTRPANNVRIRRMVECVLGAELDLFEFCCAYCGEEETAKRVSEWHRVWPMLQQTEAQFDITKAIEQGVDNALHHRSTYACRRLYQEIKSSNTTSQTVWGHFPHPGWTYSAETGVQRACRDPLMRHLVAEHQLYPLVPDEESPFSNDKTSN